MQPLPKITPKDIKTYKPSAPLTVSVKQKISINKVSGHDQAFHLILDLHNSAAKYLEGQSYGVIPPGKRQDGRDHKARLYSIASAASGENEHQQDVSLCVKRSAWQEDNQLKFGLCSDYLCKVVPGDTLKLIGPTGRIMLPPADQTADIILIATGTGVAPVRSFLQKFSRTPEATERKILVYLGFKRQDEALYCNQLNSDVLDFAKACKAKISVALSREQQNSQGSKKYVSDLLYDDQLLIKDIVNVRQNYAVYICGLKGMEEGIEKFMATITSKDQQQWTNYKKELQKLGRWNVEVY